MTLSLLLPKDPRRIMYGVTAAVTARAFLVGQLSFLATEKWQVHLVSGEPGLDDFASSEGGVHLHQVSMSREPSAGDPIALIRLWWLMYRVRPATVVMGTPKMGVLGTLAAYFARVPHRVYLLHGYRAEGLRGVRGHVLRFLDRVACAAATTVVPVSESLRYKVVSEGIVAADRAAVLGHGSANGVDLDRFHVPDTSRVREIRSTFGVPTEAKVVAFVGRLTRDKGLRELVALWEALQARLGDCWLLIAGAEEPVDDLDRAALDRLGALPRVVRLGHLPEVERVYQAADVLLMLSRREGLGMVVLEAAASGVPAVAFAATGIVDAVKDERTGFLCPSGDVECVSRRIVSLLSDDDLRQRMAHAARSRVARQFDHKVILQSWKALLERQAPANQRSMSTGVHS